MPGGTPNIWRWLQGLSGSNEAGTCILFLPGAFELIQTKAVPALHFGPEAGALIAGCLNRRCAPVRVQRSHRVSALRKIDPQNSKSTAALFVSFPGLSARKANGRGRPFYIVARTSPSAVPVSPRRASRPRFPVLKPWAESCCPLGQISRDSSLHAGSRC